MTETNLNTWVKKLGEAWIKLDPKAALKLVDHTNVKWYESPLEAPLTSWGEVLEVWTQDLNDQKDVKFDYEILACSENQGIVRWQATLTRISINSIFKMDGIFLISLNEKNLCTNFTMWTVSEKVNQP